VVDGPQIEEGWDAERGVAVSDITDGYSVVEVSGDAAIGVLKRGTEISLEQPSGSVARVFYGYPVFVYACEGPDRFRIHIPRALLDSLWMLLDTFAAQADAEVLAIT
jgi:sarcosine oxidase gamma subunit